MKLSDEFKVGILATFAIVTLIIGYSFLKGNNLFEKKQSFFVVYQNISGLSASDPILVNGFSVGRVKNVKMLPDIRQGIIAEIQVDENVKVPQGSIAKIINVDLLGAKAIELTLLPGADYLKSGDTLKSDVQLSLTEEVKLEVLPVKQKAEELMSSLDSLVTIIKTIVSEGKIEEGIDNVVKATAQFSDVAKNLDSIVVRESQNIHKILKNVEGITKNLKDNDTNITRLLVNLGDLTDSLKKADLPVLVENLNNTLKELKATLETVNKGEGTIGLLLNERETYDKINQTIADLDKLLVDVQQNPKRYVNFSLFGGKDPNKKK